MKIFTLFTLILILLGCQTVRIEKRLHLKGYTVFSSKKISKSKEHISAMESIIEKPKKNRNYSNEDLNMSNDTFDSLTLETTHSSQITETFTTTNSYLEEDLVDEKQTVLKKRSIKKSKILEPKKDNITTEYPVTASDPRVLPNWLVITLTVLLIAGLCFFSLAIIGLSMYLYLEYNLLFLAILSGTLLGYLIFFLGFWGLLSVLKRESQSETTMIKKALILGLFGIMLGVLWGLSLLAVGNTTL